VLGKFCTDVSSGCFVFDIEDFHHPPSADFPVAKLFDGGHNADFPIPIVAHISLAVMWQSSGITASALFLVSIMAAFTGQLLQGLSPVSFPPLLK
jgi:hypothetical protein